MPTYFQRPENALKRANEFIDVGKRQRALDALYDVIKSKRHRTWQKIHEPIMAKYMELCVDMRKSHIAKEGLFQYRNICQQVNIKSLEDVVRNYLQLAEDKAEAARSSSHHVVVDVDDLDKFQSPEGMLLSAVSGEDAQDRTDRVFLTPWVKFLWESYRQCLELLRNNSRVERLYHDIAQDAFKFCLKYNRKTEFRKLCDNLRTHLGHIHKHQNQQTAVNLNNPESQAMHLETRLCQLDSAIQMELWQEAYKAVEDIHGLMSMPKKAPKAQLLANYYRKLALVFWKAGNLMFHAAALFRLFTLCRELKKSLTQEEVQRMASCVLLAMLAIPIPPPRNEIDRSMGADEIIQEKHRRLATLLALPNTPTRKSLLKDLIRYSMLQHVPQQLQELYQWLEVDFHPLKLSSRIQQCFAFITNLDDNEGELKRYMPAIQENSLIRLLKQVAQVYQTIEFARLLQLAPFANSLSLERTIVDMARYSDLQVRIDHLTGTLHFGVGLNVSQRDDTHEGPQLQSMPSEQIKTQLIQMSSALHRAMLLIRSNKMEIEREQLRQTLITAYRQNANVDHACVLSRRQIIEERKEMLENLNIQKEEDERRLVEEQRRMQVMLEEERLNREADERERQREIQEKVERNKKQVKDKIEQLKKQGLSKLFIDIGEEELENLNAEEIMQRQTEQMDRERRELQAKLKAQEKTADHVARAMRIEEVPILKKVLEDRKVKNRLFWDQQEKERIETMIKEREVALQHRDRLIRIDDDKKKFMEQLTASRMSVYLEHVKDFDNKLEAERKRRLQERQEQRKENRRDEYYRQKEEQEKKRKEEEVRQREEAKKAAMEAEYRDRKAKLDAQLAKQKAREQEVEDKLKRENEKKALPERNVDKPQTALGDSWRQREGGRESASNSWRVKTGEEDNRDRDGDQGMDKEESLRRDPERPDSDYDNKENRDWSSKEESRRPQRDEPPATGGLWRRLAKEDDTSRSGDSWRRGPVGANDGGPRRDEGYRRDEGPRRFGGRDDGSRRFEGHDEGSRRFEGRDGGAWPRRLEGREDPGSGPMRRTGDDRDERGGGSSWRQDVRDGPRGGNRDGRDDQTSEPSNWRARAAPRDERPRKDDGGPVGSERKAWAPLPTQ